MSDVVQVHLFAAARAAAGQSVLTCRPGNLDDVLDQLRSQAPGLDAVLPRCSFLVDGQAIHGDHATVLCEPGARLDVLPPFAGG